MGVWGGGGGGGSPTYNIHKSVNSNCTHDLEGPGTMHAAWSTGAVPSSRHRRSCRRIRMAVSSTIIPYSLYLSDSNHV